MFIRRCNKDVIMNMIISMFMDDITDYNIFDMFLLLKGRNMLGTLLRQSEALSDNQNYIMAVNNISIIKQDIY